MSSLARLLLDQGITVSGSDKVDSPLLEELAAEGARVAVGHQAENLGDSQVVVVSAAIPEANPEIQEARRKGLEIITRAELLGRLMQKKIGIGITGTHGKTSTTGMISIMMTHAGLDPTVSIGGEMTEFSGNARKGRGKYFVAEACEAYGSFLHLYPKIAVITNIEAEHLDYYHNFDGVKKAFHQYCSNVAEDGLIIGCVDNAVVAECLKETNKRIISYGLKENADLTAIDIQVDSWSPSYTAVLHGKPLGRVQLSVPGIQNISNSLAAVAVGLETGLSFEQICEGLALFKGVHRRMEKIGEAEGILVLDDYAHHPTEIRTALAAATHALKRPLVAVFQPHLFSRTRDLLEEFAKCFNLASRVIITDIYPAREKPIPGVTSELIVRRINEIEGTPQVEYISSKEAIVSVLLNSVQKGDVVMTIGAGDIRPVGEEFFKQLEKRSK